jgi:hypothetical protein
MMFIRVSRDVNATFYIDSQGKFYFVASDTFTHVDLPQITKLKKDSDIKEVRSVQIVTGSK